MFNNEKLISFLLICFWIALWGSINSFIWPEGLIETYKSINFSKDLLVSISSLRSLSASIISIVLIFYFLYLVVLKKIKINEIHLLFILFFLCYIFGLLFNDEKLFNFTNNYLVILSFGSICLFVIIDSLKLNKIIIYFFWISLFFLIFVFSLTMISKISEINSFNLYKLFDGTTNNLLGETNPRISGLSRMLAIINLFVFCNYIKLENIYPKILSKIFLILSSSIIIFMQSRGTIVCYFFSLSILIFFINKKNKIRLKEILIFILLPILIFSLTTNILNKRNINSNENLNINNRILSSSTSGRYEIWSYTIKNYDFQKKLFGYGSNGDRFFLKQFDDKDKYSDNSSNIAVYSLLSGGPISLIILGIIFYKVLKVIILNKSHFLSDRNNFYLNLSFTFVTFFLIRSIFENSFGLFSTDFLITYLSLSYILSYLDKKSY